MSDLPLTRTKALAGPLPALADIAHNYDAVFSDIWGVVHNGVEAYADAVSALRGFRQNGGRVVLISNAAWPAAPIGAMLDRMGVPRDAYDQIVTSGDVTRKMIARYAGQQVLHIGPNTDLALFDGLDVEIGPVETAAAVVVTRLESDHSRPEDYSAAIDDWRARGLPLLCANPDKVVEIGGSFVYCPGAVADIYASRGGEVLMAGKPFLPIYQRAFERLEDTLGHATKPERILAIGDSVRTDAMGAAAAGLDFLFITGSVHAHELGADGDDDPAAIGALVAPSGARLAGYQTQLV